MDAALQDGRFLLLGRLGRGGMASVFRAFDRVDQRLVAIKVQGDATPAGPAHPLSAEFAAWTRLCHPNVVRVYDLGVARNGPLAVGSPYLVLEHVRGLPAHQALPCGRVDASTLERFAAQVLLGLEHVHRAGLVHRDLKPANLLTRRSRNGSLDVKLTDFGLAVRGGRRGVPGAVSGSIPYLSPESLLGGPLDGRSDLFGLGLVLYRLATGRLPFDTRDLDATVRWRIERGCADPGRHRPDLPGRLARFVRRLTAPEPGARPRSAEAAIRLLGTSAPRTARRAHGSGVVPGLAETRLALDSVRLGARRCHPLPDEPAAREGLLREVRVWTRTRGIRFHTLRPGPPLGTSGLARLALCLLAERSATAARWVRRFGLRRWLPIALLGGQPVSEPGPARRWRPGPEGAAAVARFVLACADEHPLVLRVEDPGRSDPFSSAVVAELIRAAEPPRPVRSGTGGLLLLVGDAGAGISGASTRPDSSSRAS